MEIKNQMAKILIIDDDPDMVLATRICLEGAGHTVLEAANGAAGLEAIRADTPELIVLDVMMDTTTEGFQLALKLRSPDPESEFAAYKSIPILMLTSIHATAPKRVAPDKDYLPVDAFIDKPIDPEQLLEQVDLLLAEKAG
jgi:CheY-like chemotaxis protein